MMTQAKTLLLSRRLLSMSLLQMLALSACTKADTNLGTLADELEGKRQMSPEQKESYREHKWYPDRESGRYPPFYGLRPAMSQRLGGTANGPGAVRLLHWSGKKTFNYMECSELAIRLLDKANVKPQTEFPSSSGSRFTQKILVLVSIDPAILIVGTEYPDYRMQTLNFQLPARGFTLIRPPSERSAIDVGVSLANVFPDIASIEVLSDQWEGLRSLAQMNADESIPFKAVPTVNVPGFLSLVLKDPGKTPR
jgi:hypothetical protein